MAAPSGHPEPPADAIHFGGRIARHEYRTSASKNTREHLQRVSAVVAALCLLVVVAKFRSQGWSALLYAAPAVVIPLIFTELSSSYGQRQWKTSPGLRREIRGWASDSELHLEHELAISTVDWRLFVGFQATDEMLMLYQSSQAYNLLSRSLFATERDWERFRQLVETKIDRPRPSPFSKLATVLFWTFFALVSLPLFFLAIAL